MPHNYGNYGSSYGTSTRYQMCMYIYNDIYIYTNIVVRYLWSYIIMYQFNNNYVTDSKLYHVRL